MVNRGVYAIRCDGDERAMLSLVADSVHESMLVRETVAAFARAHDGTIANRSLVERAGVVCTGVAAHWCPRCGDCCCPSRFPEHPTNAERTLDDPDCPLHSPTSDHPRSTPGARRG